MIPTRPLRRPRVLIVGCGDVGIRSIALLAPRFKVVALNRRIDGRARLLAAGAMPIAGDLDRRASLKRTGALASAAFGVLHFAPPPSTGTHDTRTLALIAALSQARAARSNRPDYRAESVQPARYPRYARQPQRAPQPPPGRSAAGTAAVRRATSPKCAAIVPEAGQGASQFGSAAARAARAAARAMPRPVRIVYASTTGVYGDCGGALIDETRRVRPTNARAVRRVSAERMLRAAGIRHVIAASILRIPGIYAQGRLPDVRLRRGTPALRPEDDVFTSHIHADDLAAIAVRALWRGRAQRIYHASDDSRLKMGDYFARVAAALSLPPPPRISRAQAEEQLEPMLMSFMRESRQLDNRRLGTELRYRLRYPTVDSFLSRLASAGPIDLSVGPGARE